MEIKGGLTAAALQVLDKDNYVAWTVRVKTYLMAYDLWDLIEGTTRPPGHDEAASKAWSMKNSTALNVIQISCGPDTFSKIIQISSAKIAWDTLAKKFLRILEKDNYADWSVQIKNYLMAHDLWEIIETTTEPPRQEDDEAAFKDWRNRNFMALHVIQISCGPDTGFEIIQITFAKTAWDMLAEKYAVPTGSGENGNVDYVQYEALIDALKSGNWNTAEEFLKRQPDARSAKIASLGETALHIAVIAGHEHIVQKLVDVMSVEELAIPNTYGSTPLVGALNAGNYRMTACMLRKNNNLVSIEDEDKRIPVIQAIGNGDIELARYLYSLTPLEDLTKENGAHGATLCTRAIYTRSLDIALDLIQRGPHLALAHGKEDRSPLYALSNMPNVFPSGDRLVFWKRWIYSVLALLHQPVSILLNFLGIQHLYEMKLVHAQSHELLDLMCKEVLKSNENQRKKGGVYDAVIRSVERGNFKFVSDIVRAIPNLLWTRDGDSTSIFSCAVLHRQANIFSLIYQLGVKKSMTNWINKKGNNILHMAGMTGASIEINRIPGAALQMQRELQWFKEVESMAHPKIKELFNNDGFTPRQLFTKNHKDLMKEGEKWMKDTATSCTVVGALIVTIMFAAIFTVPGGNNQETGFPIFLNENLFMVFIISDALSLFSSSTSVLMFLGILTSRYAEDDFLESLPRKMIIGLSTLFFSIAAMMIAFSAALLLMLHGTSWIFIPIFCLAGVPITLFILMQFPLLVDMFISTYRPGIFDKKMERWV